MSFITRIRRGKCVYWEAIGNDGFGGKTFADAVELDCRWDDSQVMFVDDQGKEIASQSVVYVGIDMTNGDYLKNGSLSELDNPSENPQRIDGAKEVKSFNKIPNLKYTEYLRVVYLGRQ